MRFGLAFTALAAVLSWGCETTDTQQSAAPDAESHAAASQPQLGPDGEPMADTPTGADAALAGDAPVQVAPTDDAAAPGAPAPDVAPAQGDAPVPGSPAAAVVDEAAAAEAGAAQAGPDTQAAPAPAAPWKSGQSATQLPAQAGQIGDVVRDGQAHRYELRAYGTTIEVYMDGDPVPEERIRVAGQTVGVLDTNGQVIERIDLPEGWTEEAQRAAMPDPNDPFDFRDVKGTKLVPPKVMLGGRLVEPSPALLKHLGDRGVRRDRVSMVTNVIPGLPLAQAGVQNHDLITAVNEVPDADPETVRAVIRTMKPGETIDLRVLRGTETMDFRVTSAAWDPKHMVRPVGAGGAAPTAETTAPGAAPAAHAPTVEELQADLAAADAQIAALERRLQEQDPVRKSIRPKAEPARKATQKP